MDKPISEMTNAELMLHMKEHKPSGNSGPKPKVGDQFKAKDGVIYSVARITPLSKTRAVFEEPNTKVCRIFNWAKDGQFLTGSLAPKAAAQSVSRDHAKAAK
jgi:hypothetical protein